MKVSEVSRQRGAAILLAMLIVALVAALSTGAAWRQWRNVAVQTADYQRLQSQWILQGTADWAHLLLQLDARDGAVDHLGEIWAVPLAEARLSSFLAARSSTPTASSDLPEAFLSGQIQDLQARLNVNNLIDGALLHQPTVHAFTRLWTALNLPPNELFVLMSQLPLTIQDTSDKAEAELHPLAPRALEHLAWFGVSDSTIVQLGPYVTALPERTPVNLNTASPLVLHAVIDKLDLAGAQRLVAIRDRSPFRSLIEVSKELGKGNTTLEDAQHSLNTRYFELTGQLRMEQLRVVKRVTLHRDGVRVHSISDEYLPPTTPTGPNQSGRPKA